MMKNLIFYLIVVPLIMISCNGGNKTTMPEVEKNVEAVTPATYCDSLLKDTNIYRETVLFWENSWRLKHPNYTRDSSPNLHFPKIGLEELHDKTPEADGVRMYYVIRDSIDRIPSLAMVNMIDCEVEMGCNEKCVLLSDLGSQKQYFITYSNFVIYQDRWKLKSDELAKVPGNIPVYAYNYSWEKIMAAAVARDDKGIWVTYGLRTLGPQDTKLFDYNPDPDVTGGIAYCNIMWESNPIVPSLSNVRNQAEVTYQEEFDFALPCPIYCK